jgi:uncharacterized membrane protein
MFSKINTIILQDLHHIELFILLFLIVVSIAICFKNIRKSFRKINKKTWIVLLIIFLLGLFFRMSIEHYHFIYYDENYLGTMARNIVLHNKAGQCTLESLTSDEIKCNHRIKPFTGWSGVLSIFFFYVWNQ